MVPQHSSSKNKKAALLLADGTFSIGYTFGAYSPIDSYGVPSHNAKRDSGIPVSFESKCIHVPVITTNGVDVKPQCGFSAISVDKGSTNNVMFNAWR